MHQDSRIQPTQQNVLLAAQQIYIKSASAHSLITIFQKNYYHKLTLLNLALLNMQHHIHNAIDPPLFKYFINNQNVTMLHSFIAFFTLPQLTLIAQIGLTTHRQQSFFKIIITKLFLHKYLNRIDRSNYFLFYAEPEFQTIENNTMNSLANRNYPLIKQSYQQYETILSALTSETQYLQKQQELQSIVEALFFDPDLPLPKMKRETIGLFCQSAFQQHLSMIKFPQDNLQEVWTEQPLLELKQRLEEELNIIIQHEQFQQYSNGNIRHKIDSVRYRGYKITHQNWRQYLIEGFKTHNLMVLLLSICHKIVHTNYLIITNIQDPFMRFIEFQLRSAVYRNLVLAVETKFSFLMTIYSQFYQSAFLPPLHHPPLRFFHPALSVWAQQMKSFHYSNENIYNYIVSKLRQENIRNYLTDKSDKMPSLYSALKDQMELKVFSQTKKEKAYHQNGHKLEIESFFQNNLEMYQILTKDYLEYMVDISMNEFNVHWCGHSDHNIKDSLLFQRFHRNILDESNLFYEFVSHTLRKQTPKGLQLTFLREIIKQDLQYLGLRIVKPVTEKAIMNQANKLIRNQLKFRDQNSSKGQQTIAKYRVFIDFQQKDNLLSYFASKAQITIDCPQSLSSLYNIHVDQQTQLQQDGDENTDKIEEYYMSSEEQLQEYQ